jgi:hypothetical protein
MEGSSAADEQRDQHRGGLDGLVVDGHGLQRDHRDKQDQRQPGDQDVERYLVRCLLPARALDERDHPVKEGLAGARGDLDRDAVGQDDCTVRDRAAVPAGLADLRGGLAGDRGLVNDGDAFDDVSVAGNDLVSCYDATITDS